jgi:hypothetical protein
MFSYFLWFYISVLEINISNLGSRPMLVYFWEYIFRNWITVASPVRHIQTEWWWRHSTFFTFTSPVGLQQYFCKDWQNPQRIVNPNMFCFFFNILLLKASKVVKTTVGSVCECISHLLIHPPETRKKIGLLKSFHLKYDRIIL